MSDPSGMEGEEESVPPPDFDIGLAAMQRASIEVAVKFNLPAPTPEYQREQRAVLAANRAKPKSVKATVAPPQRQVVQQSSEIRPAEPFLSEREDIRRAQELEVFAPNDVQREIYTEVQGWGTSGLVFDRADAAKATLDKAYERQNEQAVSDDVSAIIIWGIVQRQLAESPNNTAVSSGVVLGQEFGEWKPESTQGNASTLVPVMGSLRERAKASTNERAFAQEFFVNKGYDVELAGMGTEGADLRVSIGNIHIGQFELKQLTSANPSKIAQRIQRGLRQAPNVIMDLRESPLSNVRSIRGYHEALRKGWIPPGASVRMITRTMDLTLRR